MYKSEIGVILEKNPVVPVVESSNPSDTVEIAKALLRGGISIIEITLRNESAMASVEAVVKACPNLLVGVGSVIYPWQIEQAVKVGAQFAVSPGFTELLLEHDRFFPIPFIPGGCTPSEIMILLERGYNYIKLFPASSVGGLELLKALSGPLGGVKFVPTSGIKFSNFIDYLELSNVVAVGGSWLTPKSLIEEKNWNKITELAKAAFNKYNSCLS